MQGSTSMNKAPTDGIKIVLDDRKRRMADRREEMRLLAKHKKRIQARHKETDWPIDASTGNRADVDHEDVMAPLPDDMRSPIDAVDRRMQSLREEADQAESFTEPVDEGVQLRRLREAEEERLARARVQGSAWTPELVE